MASYRGKFSAVVSHWSPRSRWVWLLFVLWLTALIPELALHLATAKDPASLWNYGMYLPGLFALVPALILFAVLCLIPSGGWKRALLILFSLIVFVLCTSQLVYYRIFGCFYSAYSMANGGQVLQFWDIALKTVWQNLPVLILMLLPFLCVCIFGKHLIPRTAIEKKPLCLIPASIAVVLQIALVLCLPLFGGKSELSPYDLYHNNTDSYYSVNELGLMTAFRLDVVRTLTDSQPGGTIHIDVPADTTPTETTVPTTPATEGETEPIPTVPEPTIDTSPNALPIDFDALIAGEGNSDILEVHQYFQSRTPSNKNEKTGLFSGCNLIMITAEAFSSLIVDEVRTPTLYKMMHEGFYFTDYYVPDWGTSTTDGEYAFLTGTIPKANVWSFSRSSDNLMPLTMSRQLLGLGYNAYAYHGHTYNYYDRNEYLENLGYTYRAYRQNLDVDYTWPESDVQVIDLTTEDYVNQEPFTAYYMTISGHREFNFSGNFIACKNRELVAEEPYSNAVRAYIATQLELENSLTLLLERLEEAGVLENTVIVLTADHYPNGLTEGEISELLGHTVETNFEIFKNGCIIYKPGMTPETITAPCSHLDLLPTLSNLFGLEFDSRLYMGRDVFSDAAPLVMFRNRSWITDQASYNSGTGEVVSFTGTPVSDTYVVQIKNEVSNRFAVSSRILDYDYWRILFG